MRDSTNWDLESNGKYIELYYRTDINRCISLFEIKDLINFFDFGDRRRIAFALLACTGVRGGELVKINLSDFREGGNIVLVPVAKKKRAVYNTGTNYKKIAVRPCVLPPTLVKEIKWFCDHNYHMMKDGNLFNFNNGTLRTYLGRVRNEARETDHHPKISKSLRSGLLEENRVQLILEAARRGEDVINGHEGHSLGRKFYRIELHSFRRTYETFMYNAIFDKDLVRLVRHMGYEFKNGKETAMKYLYTPEQIGLTEEMIKRRISFEEVFYGETEN